MKKIQYLIIVLLIFQNLSTAQEKLKDNLSGTYGCTSKIEGKSRYLEMELYSLSNYNSEVKILDIAVKIKVYNKKRRKLIIPSEGYYFGKIKCKRGRQRYTCGYQNDRFTERELYDVEPVLDDKNKFTNKIKIYPKNSRGYFLFDKTSNSLSEINVKDVLDRKVETLKSENGRILIADFGTTSVENRDRGKTRSLYNEIYRPPFGEDPFSRFMGRRKGPKVGLGSTIYGLGQLYIENYNRNTEELNAKYIGPAFSIVDYKNNEIENISKIEKLFSNKIDAVNSFYIEKYPKNTIGFYKFDDILNIFPNLKKINISLSDKITKTLDLPNYKIYEILITRDEYNYRLEINSSDDYNEFKAYCLDFRNNYYKNNKEYFDPTKG
jgi:hypothetical protein